jgi:hypothetical protein
MTLLFVTPSDEPPLAANIGRHCMEKMLAETHMRRSNSCLSTPFQSFTPPSPPLASALHSEGKCHVRKSARRAPAKICHLRC